MKKVLFTIGFFLLLLNSCFSQEGIYYKAKYLKLKYNEITKKIAVDDNAYDAIKDLYNNAAKDLVIAELNLNPFLLNMVVKQSGSSGGGIFGFAASSLTGLDVTKYANAIASIMIERAKQELTVSFFNRFEKFAKENKEFQILFPKTTDNLSNLLTYSYPQMLPALRSGFFEDLKQITYHLDDVLELPRYRHLLNNFPEVRIAIKSIRLVHDLEDGTSTVADLINNFANLPEWTEEGSIDFKNMKGAIKTAAIFSESLRSKDANKIWVPAKEVKESIKDEIFVKIYMGLLWQKIKNEDIEFFFDKRQPLVAKKLTDIIAEQKNNILLFQNKLSEFSNLSDKVVTAYNEIKTKQAGNITPSNEDIYNYINISIDIADYTFSLVKIFDEHLVTDKYLTIVKDANALYKDIYSEEYTKAVNDAIDIIKEVHDLTNKSTKSETITKPGFADDKKNALDKLLKFIEKVKPYALFMANMVEAKDEAGVKAALENVILPVGSSSIKKYSRGNISVQTYLGAFLSTSAKKSAIEGSWSDKFGVIAPIGISYTPGILSWQSGGSVSLFGALFDLGAIVDYKLKKEPNPTSTDPNATVISKDYKVELGQIFSPGIYVVYGAPVKIPLSLGFGAQYGPGLSKIDAGNNTIVTNPSWRWNFFLAVDLPFFNLLNKPKKQ